MAAVGFITNAIGVAGTPESGAKLFCYVKNTTTPQAVYTNSGLTTPATNPVVADSVGAFEVYLDGTKSYTLRMKTADESVVLFEIEYDLGTGLFTVVYATIPNFNAFMQAVQAALNALGPDIIAAVEQVADIDAEVVIVADAMEDVETVADNIADVQAVAANLPQLALKAPLESPALTGTPTAPTASGGTNNTQIATTAFVNAAIAGIDADITSWGLVTRAAGFDTFAATPTSANLAALVTNETGSGSLVFSTSPSLTTPNLGTPSAAVLTNATGLPISTGLSGLAAGAAAFLATPSSANLATLLTDETGSGANVFATSPTLVTPNLGTPSAVTLTNGTGLPIATGVSGLAAGVATFLATPTSANLIAAVTNETGTGSLVFATSPTLVTPALGTPSSAVLTNATGLPISTGVSGLGSGVATFLGSPSSANLLAAITDETGSGSLVFASSPTLVTPILGVAAATSIDFAGNTANTLTASGGVLTIGGKNVVTNGSNSSLATSTSTVGSVPAWSDYESGGYATTNINAPLMFSSKYGRGASATDAVDTRFVRWANYTGGTAYTTNSNLAVSTMAGAGGNTFEWAGLFTLDSYRTAADATQDVGIYIQSIKNSTGGVWCLATELQDKGGANPTVGTVNTELAGSSLGADNNNQRIFLHIIPSSRDASQTEWGRGIVFSTGSLAKIKSALYFDGTNYDYIVNYANFTLDGTGNITALGPTHILGTSGSNTVIRRPTTDRTLSMFGGTSAATGASIDLIGSTAASLPGVGFLSSLGTVALAWDSVSISPQVPISAFDLGAADTSFARIAAGRVSIEGNEIATLSQTQTFTGSKLISVAGTPLRLTNTTNTGSNIALILEHDRATPTANDVLIMDWRMSDSAGNQDLFGRIDLVASDVTSTSEDSYFRMATMVAGTTTNILRFTPTAFRSESNDQMALGTATVSFADLFLASGGVINFNDGNLTLTHSPNLLTSSQAFLANGSGNVGSTAALRTAGSYGGGISFLDTAYAGAYAQSSGAEMVLYTSNNATRLTLGSTSTFGGALTVGGAFTSVGIDDNATGERLQLADTVLTLGASGAAYNIAHPANDQALNISGGTSDSAGANVYLFGGTNAFASAGWLRSDSTLAMSWNSAEVEVRIPFRTPTHTPASAGASGAAGRWAWDATYIYICTATNTWRRVAHATW